MYRCEMIPYSDNPQSRGPGPSVVKNQIGGISESGPVPVSKARNYVKRSPPNAGVHKGEKRTVLALEITSF